MSRASRRVDVDLTKITGTGTQVDIPQGRIVQVLAFPAGMAGVEINLDNDSTWYPINGALKLQAADNAAPFQRLSVRGPVQGGTLTLFVGDDPIPLFSAGPASAAALISRGALWLPHIPKTGGAAFDGTGLTIGGVEIPAFLASVGNAVLNTLRGGRCVAILQPGAGGQSGIQVRYCIPWVSKLLDVTVGNAGPFHPDVAAQSYHLELELAADAAGGTSGLETGVHITATDGVTVNEGLPGTNGVTAVGLGMDGAGGWRVYSLQGTAVSFTTLFSDSVTAAMIAAGWPAPVRVHLLFQDADGLAGTPASFQLWVNETLVKSYSGDALFPHLLGGSPPAPSMFRPRVFQKGNNAQAISVGKLKWWTAKGLGAAQQYA